MEINQYIIGNQAEAAQKGLDISKISLNSFIARDKNKITHYQPYITNIIKYDEVEQPK